MYQTNIPCLYGGLEQGATPSKTIIHIKIMQNKLRKILRGALATFLSVPKVRLRRSLGIFHRGPLVKAVSTCPQESFATPRS